MSKMKPELKRIHSPDVFDLENPLLREDEPYCVLVQAMFGPEGVDGEESFDMLVCNSSWLEAAAAKGAFSGRHYFIVNRFCVNDIRDFWEKVSRESAGETWDDVAKNLAKYGKWEFEDYIG